jgi:hypothetical protein
VKQLPKLPFKYTLDYRTGSTFRDPRAFSKQGRRKDFTSSFLSTGTNVDTGLSSLTRHKTRQQALLKRLTEQHAAQTEQIEIRRDKQTLAAGLSAKFGVKLSPLQVAKYDANQLTQIALTQYDRREKHKAAFNIQRQWRAYRLRQAAAAEEQRKVRAVIYIQARWRGFKVHRYSAKGQVPSNSTSPHPISCEAAEFSERVPVRPTQSEVQVAYFSLTAVSCD